MFDLFFLLVFLRSHFWEFSLLAITFIARLHIEKSIEIFLLG